MNLINNKKGFIIGGIIISILILSTLLLGNGKYKEGVYSLYDDIDMGTYEVFVTNEKNGA